MVKYEPMELNAVFGALADPTRRALTARLSRGGASVSELAAPFPVTLPAIVKHLGVLERAGVVESFKEGRVRRYELAPERLRAATGWIEEQTVFWQAQFGALRSHLAKGDS